MENRKLKNIVLLILLVTNLLLLGLMLTQRLQTSHQAQKALDDAITLLERQGISVDRSTLPTGPFPQAMTLERDGEWEMQTFTNLLGPGTTRTQRGLVSIYEGPLGRAEARSDGHFTVTLSPQSYAVDARTPAEDTLSILGFTWRPPDGADPNRSPILRQGFPDADGVWRPIFSCQAQITCEGAWLRTISGTRLVGQPQGEENATLSLPTLLVRFRGDIANSGDACTAILSAQQGYWLQSDQAGKLTLIPALRLDTNTGAYYLSALTGDLL